MSGDAREHQFTLHELEQLADLLAPRIAAKMPQHVCQFGTDDAAFLAGLAKNGRAAKSTAFATLIGGVVLGALTLLGYGVIHWVSLGRGGR